MRVIQSFKGVVIFSSILSVVCALGGMLLSMLFSTPVGSTIVAVNIIVFFICLAIGSVMKI